jgi:osmotically-inducible protein OsmY
MTQTMHRTDAQLKSAVDDELEWTPNVTATHVGVGVNHGAVTLSGEVASYPERHDAVKAAQRVRGVTAVADEMTVQTVWANTNDTDISREAGEALDRAVDVPDGSVKAEVTGHVVSLTGQVHWQYQREAAHRAVRYLRGVTDVHNLVTVKPSVSAAGIKSSIDAALLRNALLETKGTKVTATTGGEVTLEGNVHSWTERTQAEHLAWSAPGVTSVTNHIHIEY